MCGINGFSWPDREKIEEMNSLLKHRGPDDEGFFVDKNISLGHRRLSILDLTPAGKQPMCDESNSFCIVHNGEIYNFAEIRKELEKEGFKFFSHTDTEVILKSYIRWGEKCLNKFNGMWAFAIYDRMKKKIFLSRDRFGIKPLYYFHDGKKFIFSSEIKGILSHRFISKDVNENALFEFLYAGNINHGESTLFKKINQLPMGNYAIYDLETGNLKIKTYYQINPVEKTQIHANPVEQFLYLLKDAVKLRLVADVPVGSCLSGGLDSSSIVCLMRSLLPQGEISTFSLTFPGEKIDESKYQNEVEKMCHLSPHRTTFNADDIFSDFEDLLYTQEEPFETLSIYGQYRIMKLAKEHKIKVLLDGQGSDEILGGYHWFFPYFFAEQLKKTPLKFLREISEYLKQYKNRKLLFQTFFLFLPYPIKSFLHNTINTPYLSSKFVKKMLNKDIEVKWKNKNLQESLTHAEIISSLPQLLRFEDKNSMRWGVEARVPFVDYRVVEFALSLPSEFKIKNGVTKQILRESMKGIIPEKIRTRRDKIGFLTPDEKLLVTEEGKKLVNKVIMSEKFRKREFWNHDRIISDTLRYLSGKGKYPPYIWKVIITELWLRFWIEK